MRKLYMLLLLLIPRIAQATSYQYTTTGVGGYFQLYGDNFDSRGIEGSVTVQLESILNYDNVYKLTIDAILHPDAPCQFETMLLHVDGFVNDVERSDFNFFDKNSGAFATEDLTNVHGNIDGLEKDTRYGRVDGDTTRTSAGLFLTSGFSLGLPNLSVVEIGLYVGLRFDGPVISDTPEPSSILLFGISLLAMLGMTTKPGLI